MLTGVDAKDTEGLSGSLSKYFFCLSLFIVYSFYNHFVHMMHVYICIYDCACEFRRIKSEAYLGPCFLPFWRQGLSLLTASYTRVAGLQASEDCPISAGITDMLYPVWLSTGFGDLNTHPQAGIANTLSMAL